MNQDAEEAVSDSDGNNSVDRRSTEHVDQGLDLGASSASMDDEQMIMNNPHLCKLLNKMLDE